MRISVIFIVFFSEILYAQRLALPLRCEISLAGNYAELRRNHFHMGLDFKTEGKENLPVYAVADGYISRILISSNGYGRCLYIHHPALGITSVYAHLNRFADNVESWCDRAQYALLQNTLDTLLPPNLFPIRKGSLIALSGNTGSSTGPHLHFEIRDMYTEKTINPLHYYSDISDTKRPLLNHILLYSLEERYSQYIQKLDLKSTTHIISSPKIGLGIATTDYIQNSTSTMGIYQIRIYENDLLKYRLQFDSLDFGWQSHIKSVSNYSLPFSDNYKLFYESCDFNITDPSSFDGVIQFDENESKKIRIEVLDFQGNKAVQNLTLQYRPPISKKQSTSSIACDREFTLHLSEVKIKFPAYSHPSPEPIKSRLVAKSKSTDILNFQIKSENDAILKPYQIYYTPKTNALHSEKIYLQSRVDNKPKTYTGQWLGSTMEFPAVKNFGNFSLRYDIEKPAIQYVHKSQWSIIYRIQDDGVGVGKYNLYFDNNWRKIYYDEKSKQLIYKILPSDKGQKYQVRLEVIDKVGNKNILEKEIFF